MRAVSWNASLHLWSVASSIFDAIWVGPDREMLKCDLCQGEEIPACVTNCPNEALVCVEEPEAVPEV